MCLCALGFPSCGDDYDDTEIRNGIQNLEDRVAALEAWQKSVNTDIKSLQSLVTALESKNFITHVTPVMEGGAEVGYTITFQTGNSITIRHGKNGTNGTNGQTPIIGVAKDTDDAYYWTVKIGDGQAEFLTDGSGSKIPVTGPKGDTGDSGMTPHIGANGNWWIGTTDTGIKAQGAAGDDGQTPHIGANGNWWVGTTDTGVKAQGDKGADAITPQVRINTDNNEWEISTDGGQTWIPTGVKATGEKGDKGDEGPKGDRGDAVFAENGIDYTSDPNNVTFTLADGTTLTLPRANTLTVGFDSYETFMVTPTSNVIRIILPTTLKKDDYTALVAEVKNGSGTGIDIQTRAASSPWQVILTKPTFVNGTYQNDAAATITAPGRADGERAVLKITLIDSKGQEISASRVLEYFDGMIANVAQEGGLNAALADVTPADITGLKVMGTLGENDFTYIRENLTTLETLDLSGTDMTVFPDRALRFDTPNATLREVILPEGLTTIEDAAFANCSALEKLNVPSTVISLGRWILENTKVASFTIPAGVTEIPASCFYKTDITSIMIPAGVTSIGAWAFEESDKLQSVVIEGNVPAIPEGCFIYLSSLTSVTLPASVREIGADAFNQCKTGLLTLPASLEVIEERAFSNNGITQLTIPNKVTTIENSAFSANNIETIDLPASLTSLGGVAFEWKSVKTIICRAANVPQVVTTQNNPTPFNNAIPSDCVLKVPAESLSEYQAAWGSYFKTIKALE